MGNPIKNQIWGKKVGVTHEKMGIWPQKMLKMVKKVDDGPLYHQEWSKPTWVSLKYVVKWVKTVHNGLKSCQKLPQIGEKSFQNGYILSKNSPKIVQIE